MAQIYDYDQFVIGPWLGPWADALLRGGVLAIAALLWIIVLVRMLGLRSFSRMTSFDFVMTVAMGSLVASASQSENWIAYAQNLAAMAGLFAIQFAIAWLRKRSAKIGDLVQNVPVVLMRDGHFIEDALAATRVCKQDVIAKLREANVLSLDQVRAVILETTGDISVMHGERLEEELLDGVRQL